MRTTTSVLAISLCAALAGCDKRIRPPSSASSGAPHVGWVIMSGDADNPNQDFVCQSTPRTDCIVASPPAGKVFAAVYLYYHPAKTDTRYTGSIQIDFFEGSPAAHQLRPDLTVKANDSVGNQSVVGIVTNQRGTYPMTIDVVATPAPSGDARNIRDQVRVVVR